MDKTLKYQLAKHLTSLNSLVKVVQRLSEVNDATLENVSTSVDVDDADSDEEANRQRFHFREFIFWIFRNNFLKLSERCTITSEGRLGIYRPRFAFVSMRILGKGKARPRTQNDADMTRA